MNRILAYCCRDQQCHGDRDRQEARRQRRAAQARRRIRMAVVAFVRWAARSTSPQFDAAQLLELHPRTIARWQRLWFKKKLRSNPRGRPFLRSRIHHRQDVKRLLDCLGPHISCATLEIFFPLMSRRELRRILRRYRFIWRKKQRLALHELRWHRPGSVWAIDYTDPPAPIDGRYHAILVVRDLASGCQLLALPTVDQTAKTACDALVPLFRKFGPPIVLKSDNGSFKAQEMIAFLQQWNVCPFLSPPGTPEYNGAVEAGIGSIKTRTHHIAALHGRPGEWTCDDVEAARLLANATARPYGLRGPTPHVAWKRRDTITTEQRNGFFRRLSLFQARLHAAAAKQPAPTNKTPASIKRELAQRRRIAIKRTLVASQLLSITKPRGITPPINSQNPDTIS